MHKSFSTSYLWPIAPFSHKAAAAASLFCEHDVIGMLFRTFHKFNASWILPMSHCLLETKTTKKDVIQFNILENNKRHNAYHSYA